MRLLLTTAALLSFAAAPAFAQQAEQARTSRPDAVDTATIVRVDSANGVITIADDATGREQPIAVDAKTRIQSGADAIPLTQLQAGDRVAITSHQTPGATPTDTPIAALIQIMIDAPDAIGTTSTGGATPSVGAGPAAGGAAGMGAAGAAAAAAATGAAADAATMTAMLRGRDGKDLGEIRVRDTASGLLVDLDLTGLPPGTKAFHIHAVGRCEGTFESAGEHLAKGTSHGFLASDGPHAGDFPNLEVPNDGRVKQTLRAPDLRITDLHDADGAAFVLHDGADDYTSQPSGNSGERIACAAIPGTRGPNAPE
jgi:Cu-Zn family superoxide dismutase